MKFLKFSPFILWLLLTIFVYPSNPELAHFLLGLVLISYGLIETKKLINGKKKTQAITVFLFSVSGIILIFIWYVKPVLFN